MVEEGDATKDQERKIEDKMNNQYPKGIPSVMNTIKKINVMREQAGEISKVKNVPQKPLKGYITMKDIMQIQNLQQELFPDYEHL